jgi:hypothetical protein
MVGVGLAHLPEHFQLCRRNRRQRVDAIFCGSVVHHVFERACSLGYPVRPLDILALARPQAHALRSRVRHFAVSGLTV